MTAEYLFPGYWAHFNGTFEELMQFASKTRKGSPFDRDLILNHPLLVPYSPTMAQDKKRLAEYSKKLELEDSQKPVEDKHIRWQ